MMGICAVLIAIFASYDAAGYLADAVRGLLPAEFVALFVVLKIAIALEVLLPTTLYIAVVVSLGRMYRDSEMVGLESCGVGILHVFRPVFYYSCVVALVVAGISLFVRPWSYEIIYKLKAQAKSNFHISQMDSGQFYEIKYAGLVIFAEKVKKRENLGVRVFISTRDDEKQTVIFAKRVYEYVDEASGKQVLRLQDGQMYEFASDAEKGKITEFQEANYVISPKQDLRMRYRRKASSTLHLASSDKLEDIAEFQWRLSTPVSAILLGLLAVLLSHTTPRQGKYAKVMLAVVIFAIYYNVSVVAKNWVEKGTVGQVPGIWWVQLALAVVILFLAWRQNVFFIRRAG
jgi:lipopolysaccharide export system permease protein